MKLVSIKVNRRRRPTTAAESSLALVAIKESQEKLYNLQQKQVQLYATMRPGE